MRTLRIFLPLCLLLVAALAVASSGGGFTLDPYTIDNGGGVSTGGGYTLSGSIGQPDPVTLSGGTFTLNGGFWGFKGPSEPVEPVNLVLNPSFETAGTTARYAANWKLTGLVNSKIVSIKPDTYTRRLCSATKPYGTDGNCAFRMGKPVTYNQRILTQKVTDTASLVSGDMLTLSFQVKTVKLMKAAKAQFIVTYASLPKQTVNITIAKGTYAYKLRSRGIALTGTPTAVTVRFMTNNNKGMFLVDDVKLFVATPTRNTVPATDENWIPLPPQ